MPSIVADAEAIVVANPVAEAARRGLSAVSKNLPPWLFYDEAGSLLFEQITGLPEYYLTRTERALFRTHAEEILNAVQGPLTIVELGAGSAAKTGVLLAAAVRMQGSVLYQPVDVSPSALEMAASHLEREVPGVRVQTQIANYITEPYRLERPEGARILAMLIGSSIGNFSPNEAHGILAGMRSKLSAGDAFLLGTDLAPGPNKSVETLLAAYDDGAGVTAEFNRNILRHLNHTLHTRFKPECFAHEARWNAGESRIEMHLRSMGRQTLTLPAAGAEPALTVEFTDGETIHTENSYKFTRAGLLKMFQEAGFSVAHTFVDEQELFAVTLGVAV